MIAKRMSQRSKCRPLEAELIGLIGEDAYFELVKNFGGARLYIPHGRGSSNRVADVVGADAAKILADAYGGEYPRIPLSIDFRAARYRAQGLSNPAIGRKLCMTDKGVELLFTRLAKR